MDSPQIGVVIPSYNDAPFLEKLFESLYSIEAGATFLPVIVDDQSNDGTEDWIKETLKGYAVAIRPTEKAYFTQACNTGIGFHRENTHSEFYLLLNSDIVVTDGWGAALVETSHKLGAGIIGATCLLPDGRVQHVGGYGPGQHYEINKAWCRRHEDHYVPWVTGAAMAIRRDVIDRAGFLPAKAGRQYDASDRDFCTSARLKGIEVAVSAGCILYHYTHEAEETRRKLGQYDHPAMSRTK